MDVHKNSLHQIQKEQERYDQYTSMLKAEHGERSQELEAEQARDIDTLQRTHQERMKDMEKAFEVEFSHEAEQLKQKLADLREEYDAEFKELKLKGEKEYDRLQERENKRIEAYRKNQEIRIAKLHEEFQQAERNLKDYYED